MTIRKPASECSPDERIMTRMLALLLDFHGMTLPMSTEVRIEVMVAELQDRLTKEESGDE